MSKSIIKEITPMEFIMNSTFEKPILSTYENGTIMSRGNSDFKEIHIFDTPLTLEEMEHRLEEIEHKISFYKKVRHYYRLCLNYRYDNGIFLITYYGEDKISEILKKYSYHIEMSVEKGYYRCCDMLVTKNYFKEGDEEKLIEELINLIR